MNDMLQKRSIVFSISFLFGIFFCMLLSILVVGVYLNMTSMYDKVNQERATGIYNVINNDFDIELRISKHAINLLYSTLKNQVTEHSTNDDIAQIIRNQEYLIDNLCLILFVDLDSQVIYKQDRYNVIENLDYNDIIIERNSNIRSYVRKLKSPTGTPTLMMFSQMAFTLHDKSYVLFAGCDSKISNIKLFDSDSTHFKLLNLQGDVILTDGDFVEFDEMSGIYVSQVTNTIEIYGNKLVLETFSKQDIIGVFGYRNIIFAIVVIIAILMMYCVVVFYMFKLIINPIRELKTNLYDQWKKLSEDTMMDCVDNFTSSNNEISNLVTYFNYTIKHIHKFIKIIDIQKTKLSTLINSMNVGIIEIDSETHMIKNINKFASESLGLTNDIIVGDPCFNYLCSDSTGCCLNDPVECVIDGSSTHTNITFDCIIENKITHSKINVLKSLTNIPDESGKIVTLLTFINITNLKDKENELNRAVARADRATMGKTLLLGNVSHDIGNILTSLMGSAEMLNDTTLDLKQREFVNNILNDCQSVVQSVDLMREKTLLETGQSKLDLQVFDLANLLVRIYRSSSIKCQDKHIDFKFDGIVTNLSGDEQFYITADIGKINAVLTNLLDNAVKFTEHGHVSCSVIVLNKTETSISLKFVIADTGIGVNKESQSSIFKIYEQADENIQSNYGGTGIGLSICQHYVQLMGGTIDIDSTLNVGSSFSFEIEVVRSSKEDFTKLNANDYDINEDPLRILVAEDSNAIQNVINVKLKKLNCIPTIVSNGKDAVQAIETQYFDMIFMDIRMPIMNGTEAVTLIRGEKYKIPIIALTANFSEVDVSKYIEIGFDDCVGKPVVDDDLNSAIMKYKNRQLIDLDYVKSNYDTSEFYIEIVNSAKNEFELHLEMLELFKSDTNFTNITHYVKASHSIKSIASQLGMESVRHIAYILETMFSSGINYRDILNINILIDLLIKQFQKSLEYYDEYLQS